MKLTIKSKKEIQANEFHEAQGVSGKLRDEFIFAHNTVKATLYVLSARSSSKKTDVRLGLYKSKAEINKKITILKIKELQVKNLMGQARCEDEGFDLGSALKLVESFSGFKNEKIDFHVSLVEAVVFEKDSLTPNTISLVFQIDGDRAIFLQDKNGKTRIRNGHKHLEKFDVLHQAGFLTKDFLMEPWLVKMLTGKETWSNKKRVK